MATTPDDQAGTRPSTKPAEAGTPDPAASANAVSSIARRLRVFGDARRTALVILAITAIVYLLEWGEPVFVPVVISLAASAALSPIVKFLVGWRVPRVLAAALVLVTVTMVAGYATYLFVSQAAVAVDQLPKATQRLGEVVARYSKRGGAMEQLQKAADQLEKAASTPAPRKPGVMRVEVVEPSVRMKEWLWSGWLGLLQLGQIAIVSFFLIFFLLSSGDMFRRKLVKLAGPALAEKRVTVQMLDAMGAQISRFLSHMAMTSVLVGIASWLAFWWLGLEQPALWGFAAGALNLIPYVGPTMVTIAATLAALLQFGEVHMALAAGAIGLTITSLEGMLFTPYMLSRAASINPVAISLGLAFWGWVWGFWGMLLAMPILMVMKTVADHVDGLQGFGELLAS
ncbi:MAG: AI-2E family transporter [Vicinamibacteraceae bacterium]|nr:AI-2E family transporter [Vicinamibacteraceae bacterium]